MTFWPLLFLAQGWGLLADYSIKKASITDPKAVSYYLCGLICYAAGGGIWYYVFKERPMSQVGVIYPISNAIGLVLMGVLAFGEPFTLRMGLGLALGLAAILVMR